MYGQPPKSPLACCAIKLPIGTFSPAKDGWKIKICPCLGIKWRMNWTTRPKWKSALRIHRHCFFVPFCRCLLRAAKLKAPRSSLLWMIHCYFGGRTKRRTSLPCKLRDSLRELRTPLREREITCASSPAYFPASHLSVFILVFRFADELITGPFCITAPPPSIFTVAAFFHKILFKSSRNEVTYKLGCCAVSE